MAKRFGGRSIAILASGILVYPLGLLMTFNQTSLQSQLLNLFPSLDILEMTGVFLQVIGIVLIAIGVFGIVSSTISQRLQEERSILLTEITSRLNDKVNSEIAHLNTSIDQRFDQQLHRRSCRYCGSGLRKGEVFCNTCGKAQK